MKVQDLMTSDVRTCRPDTNLAEAVRDMWEGDCGALPVVSAQGHVIGMITDRTSVLPSQREGGPPNESPSTRWPKARRICVWPRTTRRPLCARYKRTESDAYRSSTQTARFGESCP